MALLVRHSWPGNVRELKNLVRRLAALYGQETIGPEIVRAELAEDLSGPVTPLGSGESLSAAVDQHLKEYFDAHEDGLPASGLYGRIIRVVERPLIERALAVTRGNQIQAARLLGLNRNTLRKKIRELDIQVLRGLK